MTLALALHIAAHVHPSSSSAAFFEPTDRPSRTSSSRRRRGREEKSLSPTLSRLHLVARRRASNFVHSSSRKSINHRNQAIRRHYSLFCNTTSDASLFVSSSSPRRPLSARFSTLVASTNPSSLALDRPRTTSSAMPSVVTLVSASSFVSRARWARRDRGRRGGARAGVGGEGDARSARSARGVDVSQRQRRVRRFGVSSRAPFLFTEKKAFSSVVGRGRESQLLRPARRDRRFAKRTRRIGWH